ncbi:MAG: hypothetical protein IKZ87_05735 [Actinomycetaceae bacterium]|nr:hypothetical protein [Actinomycetaceae bacterium]
MANDTTNDIREDLPLPAHVIFERERQYIEKMRSAGDCLYQPLKPLVTVPLTKKILDAAGVLEPVAFQIDNDTFVLHERLLKARRVGDREAEADVLAQAATHLRFRWLQVPASAVQTLFADSKKATFIKERLNDLGLGRLADVVTKSPSATLRQRSVH